MEIRLYHNVTKKIDSTEQPLGDVYETRNVRLKESTSVMEPTFLLSNYNKQYNYVYVPKWGRYYFVSDATLNIEGVFELHCKFDSLATYKTEIGNLITFIERCSDPNYYNPLMVDNAISAESKIVSSESAETDAFPSSSCYILRVMGRGSSNGIGTFVISYNDMKKIFSQVWEGIDDGSVTDYLQGLANVYINDPAQYIVGVYRSPIGLSTYRENGTDDTTIYIGGHETNLTGIRIEQPQTLIFGGRVLNKPINFYTDFRASDSAFSQYTLYIPTIGTITLPAEIMHMELKITCSADLFTGDLTFILYANDDIVATYTSNCYASVSVGMQNGSAGSNLLTNALAFAGNLAGGQIVQATEKAINGTKAVISPPASVIGTQGSIGALRYYNKFVMTCLQKSSGDAPTSVYGKPCYKVRKIGLLTGFIKCQNASINIAGTERDKELVNSYLNSGFYYE